MKRIKLEKINKTRNWLFVKINTINIPLVRLTKEANTQILKSNEGLHITTNLTEIKKKEL